VRFAAHGDQLDISWENLRVEGVSMQEARQYLPKLHAVMEHAQKSQRFYPNLSHRHYGAAVVMNNGVEAMGTNVEASRQAVQCDLRYATTQAFNHSVAKLPAALAQTPPPLKVQTVFLVNADFKGSQPIPCSDCQEWMGSRFYSPATKVVSLERDDKNNPLVRVRTVADMLPFHMGRTEPVRLTTEQPLKKLPIKMSPRAKQALQGQSLSPVEMRTMLQQAQATYRNNEQAARDSGLKIGVCAKVGSKLHSRGRFDWSTRWFEAADLRAVSDSMETSPVQKRWMEHRWVPSLVKKVVRWMQTLTQKLTRWLPFFKQPEARQNEQKKSNLHALAYYCDDPQQPSLTSLGRLARRRGSAETLVLTIENDVIQCRTIADFMPEMYQTRKK
jgi:cytidine deaminase